MKVPDTSLGQTLTSKIAIRSSIVTMYPWSFAFHVPKVPAKIRASRKLYLAVVFPFTRSSNITEVIRESGNVCEYEKLGVFLWRGEVLDLAVWKEWCSSSRGIRFAKYSSLEETNSKVVLLLIKVVWRFFKITIERQMKLQKTLFGYLNIKTSPPLTLLYLGRRMTLDLLEAQLEITSLQITAWTMQNNWYDPTKSWFFTSYSRNYLLKKWKAFFVL